MKCSVKRNKLKQFEKARIEIDNLDEFIAVIMALENRLEYMRANNWHKDEDFRTLYANTERAYKTLQSSYR